MTATFRGSVRLILIPLKAELCKKALEKVGNPNTLINVISRRVRQLTGGGQYSRPLILDTAGLGLADIAMIELIEGKIGFEKAIDEEQLKEQARRNRAG